MKLKFDIENKILIPFMVLIILPITILGLVSYWNGYQLLFNGSIKAQTSMLHDSIMYITSIDHEVSRGRITLEEGKSQAKDYFEQLNRKNMAIFDEKEYLVKKSALFTDELRDKIINSEQSVIDDSKTRYLVDRFNTWNWTVVYSVDKSFFPDELIEIQKYILLLTIIFLVLAMQASIIISHHISKPIKAFAEVCKKIENGSSREKVDIQRGDEIGILANSFNHMIDQINTSTDKLIEITKFNENILKTIDIGIATTEINGELSSINKAGKEILKKYSDVNILDELSRQTTRTIHHKRKLNRVISLSTSAGKPIYIDINTSLLKREDGSTYGAICSFNDITDRKMFENNIVRVDRLASVGQFAAGLAHEIRNPLTGIKTGIQVIMNREIKRNDTANIELMDGLTYEIDRINNLVTDLLDFSKPKKAAREKAEIQDIISKSLDLAKDGIAKKKINIRIEDGENPFYVFVDKGQVEQVFLNIITNAIEAMDINGQLAIQTYSLVVNNVPFIKISFIDNGCGIEESTINKIFDPFFTTKSKGTGLGLVVVSKLVQENDGKIEIESKFGEGTKIKVLLPEYWEDINEN